MGDRFVISQFMYYAAIIGVFLSFGCSSSEPVPTRGSAEIRAESEASAINVLRILNTATATYFARNGRYPSVEELIDAGLVNIDDALSAEALYRYSISETETGYEIIARPEDDSWAHYYCNEGGIIRSEVGRPATAESAPVDSIFRTD